MIIDHDRCCYARTSSLELPTAGTALSFSAYVAVGVCTARQRRQPVARWRPTAAPTVRVRASA